MKARERLPPSFRVWLRSVLDRLVPSYTLLNLKTVAAVEDIAQTVTKSVRAEMSRQNFTDKNINELDLPKEIKNYLLENYKLLQKEKPVKEIGVSQNNPFKIYTIKRNLSVPLDYLGDIEEGVKAVLESSILKQPPQLDGIAVAFDALQILDKKVKINYHPPEISVPIRYNVLVFSVTPDMILFGQVKDISSDTATVHVFDTFLTHVRCPSTDSSVFNSLTVGDTVKFKVKYSLVSHDMTVFEAEIDDDFEVVDPASLKEWTEKFGSALIHSRSTSDSNDESLKDILKEQAKEEKNRELKLAEEEEKIKNRKTEIEATETEEEPTKKKKKRKMEEKDNKEGKKKKKKSEDLPEEKSKQELKEESKEIKPKSTKNDEPKTVPIQEPKEFVSPEDQDMFRKIVKKMFDADEDIVPSVVREKVEKKLGYTFSPSLYKSIRRLLTEIVESCNEE